jgi:predicted RNase H-like HicB family nuclease
METNMSSSSPLASQLVQLHKDPTGLFTAQVPGVPELSVTAPTREQALEQLRSAVDEWLSSGRLVPLQVPTPTVPLKPPGWATGDSLEQEFLQELSRMRQADLERTLREYEQEDSACSHSSSTPTT